MQHARLGINVDPLNPGGRPNPAGLSPFGWVRLVLRWGQTCDAYVTACIAAGLNVLAVLGSESFTDHSNRGPEILRYAERYADRVTAWQIGNEMDIDTPSSWTLPVDQYVALFEQCDRLIRDIHPTATIITGGSASGLTHYLEQCFERGMPTPDGIGVHPYGQRPDGYPHAAWGHGNLDALIERYRVFKLPLWISEYGVREEDVTWQGDQLRGQAEYVRRFTEQLLRYADVQLACLFCYSDAMVPRYGIVDRQGQEKPVWEGLRAIEVPEPQPEPAPPAAPEPAPEAPSDELAIGPGVEAYLAAHPEVGVAVGSEEYLSAGYSITETTQALLFYSKYSNTVRRIRLEEAVEAPHQPGVLPPVLDVHGVDLSPLIAEASAQYGIEPVAILAMLKAESNLDPYAARWGVWPDISFGLCQMIVPTAAAYGIGNGQNTPENIQAVKGALFDRRTAIDVGTKHLAGNVAYVRQRKPHQTGDALILDALRVYNGGSGALDNPDWERRWAANVESYRRAIAWARSQYG